MYTSGLVRNTISQNLTPGLITYNWQILHLTKQQRHDKSEINYEKCYRILNVPHTADFKAVREAYLEMVKKFHPDSGLPEASDARFKEINDAFKELQKKYNNKLNLDTQNHITEKGEGFEEKDFLIRHTTPQHRQYLSYDGVGMGTPAQREKQYLKVRAQKTQDEITNYRISKLQTDEKGLVCEDLNSTTKRRKFDIKTKYGFDRVVEDLIQEAMSKGDFNNLSGVGKPLKSSHELNPYLDFTTQKLNKILIDNGFTPEWIRLQKDIRNAIEELKTTLRKERKQFKGDLNEYDWHESLSAYETDVKSINKMIEKYNLLVPIIGNQMFHIKLLKLCKEILDEPAPTENTCNVNTNNIKENCDYERKIKPKRDFLSFITSLF